MLTLDLTKIEIKITDYVLSAEIRKYQCVFYVVKSLIVWKYLYFLLHFRYIKSKPAYLCTCNCAIY